jgi:hypothetical protein
VIYIKGAEIKDKTKEFIIINANTMIIRGDDYQSRAIRPKLVTVKGEFFIDENEWLKLKNLCSNTDTFLDHGRQREELANSGVTLKDACNNIVNASKAVKLSAFDFTERD